MLVCDFPSRRVRNPNNRSNMNHHPNEASKTAIPERCPPLTINHAPPPYLCQRTQGPITSIEWHPTDESMLAVSGADNQLTVWDLSVEADDEAAAGGAAGAAGAGGGLKDLPPQLLFIHQGQTDIKELHFHPQIPGVIMSTAADGFNVFKPATTV